MTHQELVQKCINKVLGPNIFDLGQYIYLRYIWPEVQPLKRPKPKRFLTDRERVAKNRRPIHW